MVVQVFLNIALTSLEEDVLLLAVEHQDAILVAISHVREYIMPL